MYYAPDLPNFTFDDGRYEELMREWANAGLPVDPIQEWDDRYGGGGAVGAPPDEWYDEFPDSKDTVIQPPGTAIPQLPVAPLPTPQPTPQPTPGVPNVPPIGQVPPSGGAPPGRAPQMRNPFFMQQVAPEYAGKTPLSQALRARGQANG